MDKKFSQRFLIILFNIMRRKKRLNFNILNSVVYNVIFYMIERIQNIYLWNYVEYFNGKNVNVRFVLNKNKYFLKQKKKSFNKNFSLLMNNVIVRIFQFHHLKNVMKI